MADELLVARNDAEREPENGPHEGRDDHGGDEHGNAVEQYPACGKERRTHDEDIEIPVRHSILKHFSHGLGPSHFRHRTRCMKKCHE